MNTSKKNCVVLGLSLVLAFALLTAVPGETMASQSQSGLSMEYSLSGDEVYNTDRMLAMTEDENAEADAMVEEEDTESSEDDTIMEEGEEEENPEDEPVMEEEGEEDLEKEEAAE